MSRRRRRTWPWILGGAAVLAAGAWVWTMLRPVPATIPVPGRAPGAAAAKPEEEITQAEKKRLQDILERRGSAASGR